MQITGRNLELVRDALELADAELHNQIAHCPDVDEFAEQIEALEDDREELKRLLGRVERAIEKEQIKWVCMTV